MGQVLLTAPLSQAHFYRCLALRGRSFPAKQTQQREATERENERVGARGWRDHTHNQNQLFWLLNGIPILMRRRVR